MRKITVFRFRYYDRATRQMLLADDWATADAIAQIGGLIEPGTAMLVTEAEVSATSGLLILAKGVA